MKKILNLLVFCLFLSIGSTAFGDQNTRQISDKEYCKIMSDAEYEVYKFIVEQKKIYPDKEILINDFAFIEKVRALKIIKDNEWMFPEDGSQIFLVSSASNALYIEAGDSYTSLELARFWMQKRIDICLSLIGR